MRFSVIAASLLFSTLAATAAPVTQAIGTANILGTDYSISVLGDSAGDFSLQSFNALSPTITFTTQADAVAAGEALLAAFGTNFDWQPFDPDWDGGRIAFATDGSTYTYLTLCCGIATPNGPFTYPVTGVDSGNYFTFIQFSTLREVPEPLSLSLFGTGLAGVLAMRRRKTQAA